MHEYLDEYDEFFSDDDFAPPTETPEQPDPSLDDLSALAETPEPTDPQVPFLNFLGAYRKPPLTSRLLGRVLDARLPHGKLRIQSANKRDFITTHPVDDVLLERAYSAALHGDLMVFEGRFVPFGTKGRQLLGFELLAMHPVAPRPELLVGERDAPHLPEVDSLLDRLISQPGGVLRYLSERSFDLLGFVPVDTRRYRSCLHLLALQALSGGPPTQGENPFLSVYLSGGIGAGKSALIKKAELWYPQASEVACHGQTPAILAGKRTHNGDGWVVDPGNLPLCAGGLLVIDNFQHFPQGKLKPRLLDLLADAAGGGAVTPAGNTDHPYFAAGALILSGCRLRQNGTEVKGTGVAARLEDINLTPRLLASLDVPTFMDTDDDIPSLACEIACHTPGPECEDAALRKAGQRELRLLCTRLRQRIPTVDASAVEGELRAMAADMSVIVDDLCDRADEQPAPRSRSAPVRLDRDAIKAQIPRTLRKLTLAQARLQGRDSADRADADVAWRLASLKMEVLAWVADNREAYGDPFENRLSATATSRARVQGAAPAPETLPAPAPAPAPDGPVLPPLPRPFGAVLQALMLQPEPERRAAALQLMPVAARHEGDAALEDDLQELRARLRKAQVGAEAEPLVEWLRGAGEEQRALRALSLFAEIGPADARLDILRLWHIDGRPAVRRGYQRLIDLFDKEAGWPPRDWLAEDAFRRDRLARRGRDPETAAPLRDHSDALYAP